MKSEKMGQSLLLIAFLGFAVLLQVEGSCDLKCRSRRRPVCGTDGVTYRNRCELKKAACENPGLSVKHRRKCIVVNEKSCNSRCGSSRKPFCGTDGVTYQNRCELKRAICKDPKLSLKHKGACKDPCEKEICPLIKCAPGFISKIIGSDCCSTCVLDCSKMFCPQVACQEGLESFVPDGSCCPDCRPTLGGCPVPSKRACFKGGPDDVPGCESDSDCKGIQKCCQDVCTKICKYPVPDCRLILCDEPICPEGQETYTADGECCPKCRPINFEDSICFLPEEVGQCKAAIPRWRFNFEKCECEQFTYGGCGGNENNFETEQDCSENCGSNNIVNCLVSPCEFATCPGYKDAECVENYCGGCNALWYVKGERVTCNDCSLVDCPIPACLKGYEIYTPEGECCPQCRPVDNPCDSPPICITLYDPICGSDGKTYGNDCEFSHAKLCEDPSLTKVHQGICKADCRLVRCALPECPEGQTTYIPEGQCCPQCRPGVDCRLVRCALPECHEGQTTYIPEGQCCPQCRSGVDCSLVLCALPECPEGQDTYIPEGECCPHCRSEVDCSLVDCASLVCNEGQETYTPEGECCPECTSVCNLPVEVGPCEAAITRWGFGDQGCVGFIYGGCEGNGNNFESQEDCENVCELG